MKKEIPIWERINLSLEEASAYAGFGIGTTRKLCDEYPWIVMWRGSKRMIRRKPFEELLEKLDEI